MRMNLLCRVLWSDSQFEVTKVSALAVEGNKLKQSSYWDVLGALWDRATGGSDVAARPEAEQEPGHVWPTAPRPPAVEEASDWFSRDLVTASTSRMLFLVGGPGAGKSHTAAEIVQGLSRVDRQGDDLAHRSYRYAVGATELLLVNDATIGSGDQTAPLAVEIDSVVAHQNHLVACVNRGVLVEESGEHAVEGGPSALLLAWLAEGRAPETTDVGWSLRVDAGTSYLKVATLLQSGRIVARITAVFVDVCSLLERRPSVALVSGEAGQTVKGSAYRVAEYAKRSDWPEDATPAGALLKMVIAELDSARSMDPNIDLLDPIAANVSSLRIPSVRAGILSIVRAAEIMSGQKMTYRDVWGTISRCVVGSLPERVSRAEVRTWIHGNQPHAIDPLRRFAAMQKLANLRFSQTLFGVGMSGSRDETDLFANPVTKLTFFADPMRDATPGVNGDKGSIGWFSRVADAFSGPAVSGSPLESLALDLAPDDPFRDALSAFDRNLDDAFVAAMASSKVRDADRYEFISWYAAYIGRLYAIANSIPAFRPEVALWTQAWALSPNLPPSLSNGLRTLLRPKRRPGDVESSSLIPILDSRTDPIVGMQSDPKLALMTGDVEMRSEAHGESLFLVLSEKSNEIARMTLDFALVREAATCGSDHAGVTDLTQTTSPRLERFRAARLVPVQLENADYRVVKGESDFSLSVLRGNS